MTRAVSGERNRVVCERGTGVRVIKCVKGRMTNSEKGRVEGIWGNFLFETKKKW